MNTLNLKRVLTFVALIAVVSPSQIRAAGLIRSIWACSVPCHSTGGDELIGYIHVAYCSTTTLSLDMIANLSPVCQAKTGRSDAKAVRSSSADVATCVSSSNACPTEGLTLAGFTCQYTCPSQDKVIRKYTACAKTDQEAWSHASRFCQDAVPPSGDFFAHKDVCTSEGQTPCE